MSFLDSDDSDGGSTSGTREKEEGLRVNEKFARRFEKRKRAQELEAANRVGLSSDGEDSDSDESESETEDEDADLLTPALDLQIIKTINKIRGKDPDIYNIGKEWF
ncbi:unnamed protein product, partial [Discosporangium mesarthrocarpum]